MKRDTGTAGGRRLLLAQLRTQRRPLLVGVCIGLVWTVAKIAIPLVLAAAIDRGITGDREESVVWWAVLVAVLGLLSAGAGARRRFLAFQEARWAESDLRDRLFAHVQRLHFGYHDTAQTGQLMSRANSDSLLAVSASAEFSSG